MAVRVIITIVAIVAIVVVIAIVIRLDLEAVAIIILIHIAVKVDFGTSVIHAVSVGLKRVGLNVLAAASQQIAKLRVPLDALASAGCRATVLIVIPVHITIDRIGIASMLLVCGSSARDACGGDPDTAVSPLHALGSSLSSDLFVLISDHAAGAGARLKAAPSRKGRTTLRGGYKVVRCALDTRVIRIARTQVVHALQRRGDTAGLVEASMVALSSGRHTISLSQALLLRKSRSGNIIPVPGGQPIIPRKDACCVDLTVRGLVFEASALLSTFLCIDCAPIAVSAVTVLDNVTLVPANGGRESVAALCVSVASVRCHGCNLLSARVQAFPISVVVAPGLLRAVEGVHGSGSVCADGSVSVVHWVDALDVGRRVRVRAATGLRGTNGRVVSINVGTITSACGSHPFGGDLQHALGTVGARFSVVVVEEGGHFIALTLRRPVQVLGVVQRISVFVVDTLTVVGAGGLGVAPAAAPFCAVLGAQTIFHVAWGTALGGRVFEARSEALAGALAVVRVASGGPSDSELQTCLVAACGRGQRAIVYDGSRACGLLVPAIDVLVGMLAGIDAAYSGCVRAPTLQIHAVLVSELECNVTRDQPALARVVEGALGLIFNARHRTGTTLLTRGEGRKIEVTSVCANPLT
jgi:hypothetical protein